MNLLFYHYLRGAAIKLKLQRSNVPKRFERFVARGCLPVSRVYPLIFQACVHRSTCMYIHIHAFVTSYICRSAALCICCMCNPSNCDAFSCHTDANIISVDLAETKYGVSICGKNSCYAPHCKCIILRRIHSRSFTHEIFLASRLFIDQ